jgi:hypothetical protein
VISVMVAPSRSVTKRSPVLLKASPSGGTKQCHNRRTDQTCIPNKHHVPVLESGGRCLA